MKEQLIDFQTAKLAKEKGFGLGENDYIMLPSAYELNGNLYNNGELTGSVSRKYNVNPNHLGADTINDFEASVFIIDNSLDDFILAPTQSLLQKWVREVHGIDVIALPTYSAKYIFRLYQKVLSVKNQIYGDYMSKEYANYEEALENGLQKALKLI